MNNIEEYLTFADKYYEMVDELAKKYSKDERDLK